MCSHPCTGDLQTDGAPKLLTGPVKPRLHNLVPPPRAAGGGANIQGAGLHLGGRDKRLTLRSPCGKIIFFLMEFGVSSYLSDLLLLLSLGAERVQQPQVQHGLHRQDAVCAARPPGPATARGSTPRHLLRSPKETQSSEETNLTVDQPGRHE